MAVVISSVMPVLSNRPDFLPFSYLDQLAPLSIVAEVTATWSVALLKTSIALMLLQLQRTRGWSYFLYTIIGVQMLTATFVTVLQTTRCIPMRASWNPTITDKRCWSENAWKASLTVASVLIIVTDVIFALIPVTFLRHIRRSLRDRVIIGILMGLGLFASAASIVKLVMVQRYDGSGDSAANGLSIALWASIEAQVGIIAASIPCLRVAFQRFLSRIGIITSSEFTSGNDGAKSTWQGVHGKPTRNFNSRSAHFHGGGPRTSVKIMANQSDEDILVPGGSSRGVQHGGIERKTEIDIELASVKTT